MRVLQVSLGERTKRRMAGPPLVLQLYCTRVSWAVTRSLCSSTNCDKLSDFCHAHRLRHGCFNPNLLWARLVYHSECSSSVCVGSRVLYDRQLRVKTREARWRGCGSAGRRVPAGRVRWSCCAGRPALASHASCGCSSNRWWRRTPHGSHSVLAVSHQQRALSHHRALPAPAPVASRHPARREAGHIGAGAPGRASAAGSGGAPGGAPARGAGAGALSPLPLSPQRQKQQTQDMLATWLLGGRGAARYPGGVGRSALGGPVDAGAARAADRASVYDPCAPGANRSSYLSPRGCRTRTSRNCP